MNQAAIQSAVAGVMPLVRATGLLVSLATFQAPTGNQDSSGSLDGTFANVAGLVNIPCTAPPANVGSITASVNRTPPQFLAYGSKHCLLDNYYPAVEGGAAAGWRAVIDGTNYTLMGAESDSQHQMTRFEPRLETL